jgi:hypothetical protein
MTGHCFIRKYHTAQAHSTRLGTGPDLVVRDQSLPKHQSTFTRETRTRFTWLRSLSLPPVILVLFRISDAQEQTDLRVAGVWGIILHRLKTSGFDARQVFELLMASYQLHFTSFLAGFITSSRRACGR